MDLLTATDVNSLDVAIKAQCGILLEWLGNEKLTVLKTKLRTAVSQICDAYSKMSRAYVCKLMADSVTGNLKQSLDNACINIEQAASKLLQAAQPTVVNAPETSYADVVSRSRGSSRSNNANWPLHKISLAGRKTLP